MVNTRKSRRNYNNDRNNVILVILLSGVDATAVRRVHRVWCFGDRDNEKLVILFSGVDVTAVWRVHRVWCFGERDNENLVILFSGVDAAIARRVHQVWCSGDCRSRNFRDYFESARISFCWIFPNERTAKNADAASTIVTHPVMLLELSGNFI